MIDIKKENSDQISIHISSPNQYVIYICESVKFVKTEKTHHVGIYQTIFFTNNKKIQLDLINKDVLYFDNGNMIELGYCVDEFLRQFRRVYAL